MFLLESFMDSPWPANLVSTGALMGLLAYFAKRYVTGNDSKLKNLESKIEAAKEDVEEVKKNYNAKFVETHRRIEQSAEQTRQHFDRKIGELAEKNAEFRIQNAREMGTIVQKLDNLNNNR